MRYKLLGRSGLRVSELSLGTMTFGTEWGWGCDYDTAKSQFELFAEAGGNFIDTADFYTQGTSERFLGDFLAEDRERFILATKYSLNTTPGDPNAGGNHRKNLVQSVEGSLKRMNLDYIDLLWVHAWDFTTGPAELMRALDDLVRAGKVLHVGISDTPAWLVATCNTLADLRGWSPFVGLQIEYSLVERTPELELLPMAQHFDLPILAWSPLGGGVLTGKYKDVQSADELDTRLKSESKKLNEDNLAIARELSAVAEEAGCTSAQAALNWLRYQPNVIPIIGASKTEQLKDNLACLEHDLNARQLHRLNEITAPSKTFPTSFLSSEMVTNVIYGGTQDQLELSRPLAVNGS